MFCWTKARKKGVNVLMFILNIKKILAFVVSINAACFSKYAILVQLLQ